MSRRLFRIRNNQKLRVSSRAPPADLRKMHTPVQFQRTSTQPCRNLGRGCARTDGKNPARLGSSQRVHRRCQLSSWPDQNRLVRTAPNSRLTYVCFLFSRSAAPRGSRRVQRNSDLPAAAESYHSTFPFAFSRQCVYNELERFKKYKMPR